MAVDVEVNDAREGPAPVGFVEEPARLVERTARAALDDQGITEGALSFTLLDDRAMIAMNRQWKGREESTDVLAFALHDEDEPPLGDVYLGVDRAREQADEMGEPPGRELARLTVHGTLHVLGWDHPEEGREASEMWQHQERIVAALGVE